MYEHKRFKYWHKTYKELVNLFKLDKSKNRYCIKRAAMRHSSFKNSDFVFKEKRLYKKKTYKELKSWYLVEPDKHIRSTIKYEAKKYEEYSSLDFKLKKKTNIRFSSKTYEELKTWYEAELHNRTTEPRLLGHIKAAAMTREEYKSEDFLSPHKLKRWCSKKYKDLVFLYTNSEQKFKTSIKRAAKKCPEFKEKDFVNSRIKYMHLQYKDIVEMFKQECDSGYRMIIKGIGKRMKEYKDTDFPVATASQLNKLTFEKCFKPIVKNLITYQKLSPNLD